MFAIALLGGAGLSGVIREKTATGANYGSVHPALDMPVLPDMATAGSLKMDDLISRTYTFDQINEGFDPLMKGEVARGVILMD